MWNIHRESGKRIHLWPGAARLLPSVPTAILAQLLNLRQSWEKVHSPGRPIGVTKRSPPGRPWTGRLAVGGRTGPGLGIGTTPCPSVGSKSRTERRPRPRNSSWSILKWTGERKPLKRRSWPAERWWYRFYLSPVQYISPPIHTIPSWRKRHTSFR
jgi:hypothetical protein